MNKIILTILAALAFNFVGLSYAEDKKADDMIPSPSWPLTNPFHVQLPEVKKEEAVKIPTNPDDMDNDFLNRRQRSIEQAPIQKKEEPIPKLDLTGLIWNSDRPQAIINGQVVSVGDTVSEVKITAINKSGVDIEFKGKTLTISPETNQKETVNE